MGILPYPFRNDLQNGIYGNFIYIKDISRDTGGQIQYPRFCDHEKYRAVFSPHKAEFFRNENGIDSTTEIIVSPEENAEIRKVTIANHCDGDIILDITNYQEMVLATLSADSAHPAFSNLLSGRNMTRAWNV